MSKIVLVLMKEDWLLRQSVKNLISHLEIVAIYKIENNRIYIKQSINSLINVNKYQYE